ncbi:hypothetical protein [Paenibacillus sp. J2TS4]|uniref:hypothetical protein n=1 Tax=Paenibacillus sp. J2TS4 TaxID=2807194 RepID=UPI001B2490E6|nr:hypothetical protein [Paenibacillus sp. J2TS4]GIP34810.1 hypothetical protein J2TS4_40200 [Paenibacillus sp. J2TS4]
MGEHQEFCFDASAHVQIEGEVAFFEELPSLNTLFSITRYVEQLQHEPKYDFFRIILKIANCKLDNCKETE